MGGWLLAGVDDPTPPSWLDASVEREVRLIGRIASEPDIGLTSAAYRVGVERLEVDGRAAGSGSQVLVYFNQYARYLPGDRVVVEGDLRLPPTFDTFDYGAFLARRGISATMFRPQVLAHESGNWRPGRALTDLRLSLDRSPARSLPEPEASLAAGIAFGREDGLSPEALEDYNRSGLRHLVAVSGSNVILVAALAQLLAVPTVGRKWAWLPAAMFVAVYLAAAGLSPSVMRSGLMAGVLLAGHAIGRPQSGLPALAGALIVMTALEPDVALQTGFQLSAAATAGLITLAPWLNEWLLRLTSRSRWTTAPRWLCEATALTVAATISTLPIMWATFGEISVVSPAANVVAGPAFAASFVLSVATALLGLWSRELGETFGLVAFYPLAFLGAAAAWFGSLKFASVEVGTAGPEIAVAAYAVLAVLAAVAYRFQPVATERRAVAVRRRTSKRVLLAGATGAVALAIIPVSCAPRGGPGELVVDFLDIGQGDAALITTPGGRQVLIDGGPSGLELSRELGAVMPHWDRRLDAIVLSHPQEDHAGGLPEILDRLRVANVLDGGTTNATLTVAEYERRTAGRTALVAGDEFQLDGVSFEVLWPPAAFEADDLNELSVVIRVSYGEITFLFTGDVQGEALDRLLAEQDLTSDVLKVPHHGSKTTGAAFFTEAKPSVAVISTGADNLFGHPHPDTLAALDGVLTFRTDVDGRVRVRSDGQRLSVDTER